MAAFRYMLETNLEKTMLEFQEQTSFFQSTTVAFSDSHPTLYEVHGRAKPVFRGLNSTEPNLFLHGETTYRIA